MRTARNWTRISVEMGTLPPWWGVFRSGGDKQPLGMALRYSSSYPGTSQGVFQLCLLWFHNVCTGESCRNDVTFAESMGQWEDKLVMHHHVCVYAHESFPTHNQQTHHPNTYLRIVEHHFSVVLCDDWKKKRIMPSQGCPRASWRLPQLSCKCSSLAFFWGAFVVVLLFPSVSLSR